MKKACICNAVVLTGAAILSGCAVPLPPTYSDADVTAFAAKHTSISISPNSIMLPGSGTAQYTGMFGAGLSVGGNVLGDIAVSADFGGSSISGRVDNINVLGVDGLDDQALGGHVPISGSISGTSFAASGQGELSGVAFGFKRTANASVSVSGQFKDYLAFYDALSGTLDFSVPDFDMSATGVDFYAE